MRARSYWRLRLDGRGKGGGAASAGPLPLPFKFSSLGPSGRPMVSPCLGGGEGGGLGAYGGQKEVLALASAGRMKGAT